MRRRSDSAMRSDWPGATRKRREQSLQKAPLGLEKFARSFDPVRLPRHSYHTVATEPEDIVLSSCRSIVDDDLERRAEPTHSRSMERAFSASESFKKQSASSESRVSSWIGGILPLSHAQRLPPKVCVRCQISFCCIKIHRPSIRLIIASSLQSP